MQNKSVAEIIANLRGRKRYEERKALKLGFTSLVDYYEDKLKKQAQTAREKEEKRRLLLNVKAKNKNSCSCCN